MAAARDDKCRCGRPKADANFTVFESSDPGHVDGTRWVRHTFYRCECGNEWTKDETTVNPNDTVTSDEVVSVHEYLKKFEGSLTDLVKEGKD